MENLVIEGISHNLQYVFTNKGVTKISAQLNDLNGENYVPYTYDNLNVAIDIMRENIEFKYRIGKLDIIEYAAAPRKFLNNLVEIFKPQNPVSLIKEWETIFGNDLILINESVDKLVIESRINQSWDSFKVLLEVWYNPADWGKSIAKGAENVYNYGKEKVQKFTKWTAQQAKEIQDKGIWNYAKETGASLWDTVKNAVKSAYKCLSNNITECLMENLRHFTFTAGGVAALTGLSMITAIGQIPTLTIFGGLLLWDLYKMSSGKYESGEYKWGVFDIVIDAVSLLLPALGKVVKGATAGIKTFAEFGKRAVTEGGLLLKLFNLIKGGIAKLGGYVTKAATWLGEKLGMTSLKAWSSNATSQLNKISNEMIAGSKGKLATKIATKTPAKPSVGLGQKTKNFVNKTYRPNLGNAIPPSGVILKSAGKTFLVTTALCSALGLDGFTCRERIESGEVTPEQISQAELKIQQELGKNIASSGGFDDVITDLD